MKIEISYSLYYTANNIFSLTAPVDCVCPLLVSFPAVNSVAAVNSLSPVTVAAVSAVTSFVTVTPAVLSETDIFFVKF